MAKKQNDDEGIGAQLIAAKKLATVIELIAAKMGPIEKSFSSQAKYTAQMAEDMKTALGQTEVVDQLTQVNETLKKVASSLESLSGTSTATFNVISAGATLAAGSMNGLTAAAEKTGKATGALLTPMQQLKQSLSKTGHDASSLREKMKKIGSYLEGEFPVAIATAVAGLSGLRQGFSNLIAMGSSIMGFATGLIDSLFEIGRSIISIPFKMFDGLIEMAKKAASQITELAIALNNIKKEFGHLGGPVASTIQSVAKDMKGFAGAGVGAFQVFGNVAERMEKLNALFVAGGPVLQLFNDEFKDNGGALMGYQRGLGLTDEQMGAIALTAKSTGTSMSSVLNSMTKQAHALGKEFGIDAKIISKNMAKATADVAHFGNMSQKQIGVAVVYAHKLGLELDKVTGVLDAFSTFDDAADKVSTLNQVFGTQIDAMKLVNAQDPTEVIAHLRKEFAAAGISGEKLTRAQRAIIKQNTGLDDSQIALALSSKNQGVSLDKVAVAADKAQAATLSQAAALKQLSGAMERTLKAAEPKKGGFISYFFEGFADGIRRTAVFRTLLHNIQASLMQMYAAGLKVGKAFVEYFPGVKDFIAALGDLFSPAKFKKLSGGLVDVFTQFFKDLNDPSGKASFSGLMDNLKKKFFDFFDQSKGPGSKLMSSFGKIMDAIKVILAGGIQWVMEKMGGFIRSIVDAISNPGDIAGAIGGAGGAAAKYMSPITEAFKNGWAILGPALKDLMTIMFDGLLDIIKDFAI